MSIVIDQPVYAGRFTTLVVSYGDGEDVFRTSFHYPYLGLLALHEAFPEYDVLGTVSAFRAQTVVKRNRRTRRKWGPGLTVSVPPGTQPKVLQALARAQEILPTV